MSAATTSAAAGQRRDPRAGVGAARPDRGRARVPRRVPVRSADRGLRRGAEEGRRRLPRRARRARRAVGDQADADRRRDLGAAQPRLRHRRRLVDRQVRLSRQEPAAHLHRPAVLGQPGDRRPDLRSRLRPAGLVRRLAARPRPEDHLRPARDRDRDDLHHLPVHRPRADPADAGAGHRAGRGGARARRRRLADLSPHHAAEREVGAALRRHPLQRAGDGRVRRGQRRLGPYPRPDQHHAAAHRDPLQRIPVRGRVRGRVAARRAGAGDARAQVLRRAQPRREVDQPRRSRRPRTRGRHEHRGPRPQQALRRDRRLRQPEPRHPVGRAGRAARPVGLGQDDAAAHHRRPRGARFRHRPVPRRRRDERRRARAPRRLRLPALRPVRPHDDLRERRLRPARAAARRAGPAKRRSAPR